MVLYRTVTLSGPPPKKRKLCFVLALFGRFSESSHPISSFALFFFSLSLFSLSSSLLSILVSFILVLAFILSNIRLIQLTSCPPCVKGDPFYTNVISLLSLLLPSPLLPLLHLVLFSLLWPGPFLFFFCSSSSLRLCRPCVLSWSGVLRLSAGFLHPISVSRLGGCPDLPIEACTAAL